MGEPSLSEKPVPVTDPRKREVCGRYLFYPPLPPPSGRTRFHAYRVLPGLTGSYRLAWCLPPLPKVHMHTRMCTCTPANAPTSTRPRAHIQLGTAHAHLHMHASHAHAPFTALPCTSVPVHMHIRARIRVRRRARQFLVKGPNRLPAAPSPTTSCP